MQIRYPATIEHQEDGGFLVQFVDFDNIFTEGDTLEEAQFNAAEVLSGMLGWMMDKDKEIPAPSQRVKDAHYIAPDAKTQAALLLLRMKTMKKPAHPGEILREDVVKALGLSVTEAAQRLGVSRVALSRVLNCRAAVSPELAIRLEAAGVSTARAWLAMQMNYDLSQIQARARRHKPKVTAFFSQPVPA